MKEISLFPLEIRWVWDWRKISFRCVITNVFTHREAHGYGLTHKSAYVRAKKMWDRYIWKDKIIWGGSRNDGC